MRFAFVLISFVALLGCSREAVDGNVSNDIEAPASTAKKSGIDLAGMDISVRPQADLFAFANGNWLKNTAIPADKASWGSFNILHEQSLEQLQEIIKESAHSDLSGEANTKIGAFYRAWLNDGEIELRGTTPIANELAAIDQANSFRDIMTLFALNNEIGLDSPLNFWVGQDDKDSTRYVVYLSQSGLGLPDRDYYFDQTERGQEILSKYQDFIATLFSVSGVAEDNAAAELAATRIIALESKLAKHHWTKVENRDSEKTYNKRSSDQVNQILNKYHFDVFSAGVGVADQTDFIVQQPNYLSALNNLAAEEDLRSWQDYLRFNMLISFAPYLSSEIEQTHFEFYGRTLNGQPEQQARWKRAISSINSNMGELLGQLYVAKHFPPEAKARVSELVDNLIAAYRASISELEWMGPETKKKALKKLGQFTPKIGYPDKWKDYSTLHVADDDLTGNIKRARVFNHVRQLDKLGKPVDRDEWFMSPQRVNAYYNPGMNEIVFPAAILQPPFFDLNADDAVNYGGIGGVIGHEIGHGFDDQGSKYTGEGNLKNWWTSLDRENFDQRTRRLVEQYSKFEALPEMFINGELTLGENIGDLGGLSIAIKAYLLSLDGAAPPVLDGFNGQQRVLLGWAQVWRVKRRTELAEKLLKIDPHSPPNYRVNGVVPNIDDFYSAFNIKPEDPLYLPPDQRVKIW
jgi:predicted metalloendopeptidase